MLAFDFDHAALVDRRHRKRRIQLQLIFQSINQRIMKCNTILQYSAALALVSASHDAYLWTIDSVDTGSNQANSVSSFAAEQILARRNGRLSYLSGDDSLIADLNKYGGIQAGFGHVPAKILIEIAGYQGCMLHVGHCDGLC